MLQPHHPHIPTITPKSVHLVVGDGLEVYLPLAELVDAEKEKKRLGKQRDKVVKVKVMVL